MNNFDLKKFLIENKLTSNSKKLSEQEDPEVEKLKDLLKKDYDTFVRELGDNIKDPKFVQAIKTYADERPVQTASGAVGVSALLPTQNEIDVDKSLSYPLTNPGQLKGILDGGVQAPGGNAIVTGGGKYIIDGHHRWSQVYVINPKAGIKALDLTNIKTPSGGLKSAQLGIAGDIGKVPTQSVQGSNLINISKNELGEYIKNKIVPGSVEVFVEKKIAKDTNDIESIIEYIWKNVEMMQTKNAPVSGSPKRDIMPQTDTASNWQDDAPAV